MMNVLRNAIALLAASSALSVRATPFNAPFTRGDVDQGGRMSIADAVHILGGLFHGQDLSCNDAADVNDDGELTLSDPVFLLHSLFEGGPPPPAPFPGCGTDRTGDGLTCDFFEVCRHTFSFLGREISADSVFFVIQTSGDMAESGDFYRLKAEISKTIGEMTSGMSLALTFFDNNVRHFPNTPGPALISDDTRTAARAFLREIDPGVGLCADAGLLNAIEAARHSEAKRKIILFVTDANGICRDEDYLEHLDRTLKDVTLANSGIARIYTFGVLNLGPAGESFLRALAVQNGGDFMRP